MSTESELLFRKIAQSKGYKGLCPTVINRVLAQSIAKYPISEVEKKVKNHLHQIWGAYFTTRPNFSKLLTKLSVASDEQSRLEILRSWLDIHTSTKERISYFEQLYSDIFELSGKPSTIIDLGCGFSPLAALTMAQYRNVQYTAYDIDNEQSQFFNELFKLFGVSYTAHCGDLMSDSFPAADLALLFKVAPLLETQKSGSTLQLLERLDVRYIAITFPKSSLGGVSKGMAHNYRNWFDQSIAPVYPEYQHVEYSNELLFLVRK